MIVEVFSSTTGVDVTGVALLFLQSIKTAAGSGDLNHSYLVEVPRTTGGKGRQVVVAQPAQEKGGELVPLQGGFQIMLLPLSQKNIFFVGSRCGCGKDLCFENVSAHPNRLPGGKRYSMDFDGILGCFKGALCKKYGARHVSVRSSL